MYYFTSDEHYGHRNIINYCNRPFSSIEEMDETIIQNHNNIVTSQDTVIHIGDFCLASRKYEYVKQEYIKKLTGNHIFIPGSHDYWLKRDPVRQSHIWQKSINKQQVICCHYPMLTWPASHWGSWLLFGHSHGKTNGVGKSIDVGVDVRRFKPISFEQIAEMMKYKPNNVNQMKNVE